MNDIIIKLDNLTKTYGKGKTSVLALNDVSLGVAKSDFTFIVGPSGSGKSTLLHCMCGLEEPTSGKCFWTGRNVYAMSDADRAIYRRGNIGFVFQMYNLIDELTAIENVVLPCFKNSRKDAFKKGVELLQYLGIKERMFDFPVRLSGGERQRVAIARALINDPEVILCDEPTGNLDEMACKNVMSLLNRLNKEDNKTIIMVTHNAGLVSDSSKIMRIESGAVMQ
ncbi:MAG: ABC transporter ATP-binding protein [Candidatus Omnitrophica bacterium]|nr:ABC transporter ATP-binding protein [Candidatus Omnitrophota bacterium]MDD5081114.1 ABC transporter ATP-binding protein [Candidatus Omnitrophota bacterium]MDD5441643.1 ABC transporter ATP-binding protein [Candidatus Omnitrophota bacterium]